MQTWDQSELQDKAYRAMGGRPSRKGPSMFNRTICHFYLALCFLKWYNWQTLPTATSNWCYLLFNHVVCHLVWLFCMVFRNLFVPSSSNSLFLSRQDFLIESTGSGRGSAHSAPEGRRAVFCCGWLLASLRAGTPHHSFHSAPSPTLLELGGEEPLSFLKMGSLLFSKVVPILINNDFYLFWFVQIGPFDT